MMHTMMSQTQVFQVHAALALQLIALVAGCWLLSKACAGELFCKTTGKVIGGLVIGISLLSIVCIAYLSIQRCCSRDKQMSPMRWQHPPMEAPEELPGPATPKKPK